MSTSEDNLWSLCSSSSYQLLLEQQVIMIKKCNSLSCLFSKLSLRLNIEYIVVHLQL